MKQSLPSLAAATICGLAGTLGLAAVDGTPPIPAGLVPARSEVQFASPASPASPTLGAPSFDMPPARGPFLPPAREAPGLLGPHGIVPATHVEEQPAASAVGPPPPPPPAATLIADSIRRLSARRSITAKTRQGAKLFGRELVGSGSFAQGPTASRLVRYDLQLLMKNRAVTRLQVSDGQYLWIVDDVKGEQDIERIEVDRLVTAFQAEKASAADGAGAVEAAAVAAPRELALGGIARLMASLDKSFEFSAVVPSQLGNVAVYAVEGAWKPAILGRAMPDQFVKVSQGQGTYDTSALRGHIPNQVVVFLGVDDLFPYRIEYRRVQSGGREAASGSSSSTGSAGGTPAGAGPANYELLSYIDFFEVRFDVFFDPHLFTFSPGTRPYIDITESYLAKQKK
jgi:hypothetical protein